MCIHSVDFEYFYKNAPNVVLKGRIIAPVATSAEARIYFWYRLGFYAGIEWSEVDSIRIVQLTSHYIKD